MMSSNWFPRVCLAALCCAACGGCLPSGHSQWDEEREPHFLAGRNRVNQFDYQGAIEAFHKALEANPRSAAAHLELGILYEDKDPNPAAAIYHYQQYLRLRPDAGNAQTIGQRIFRAKQELAKGMLPMPATPGVQRELEQLAEENRQLREEVEKWRAYFASRAPAAAVSPVSPSPTGDGPNLTTLTPEARTDPLASAPSSNRQITSSPTTARVHKVQSGESPYSIARRYGIKVDTLLSANPGLDPRRMPVGKVLNVPAP